MKKVISLFARNYDGDRLVRDEVVTGAEWVSRGEGLATRKFDGTCCLVRDGRLYKRYNADLGAPPPREFFAAQDANVVNGQCPGWLPVSNAPEDRWHREAFSARHLRCEDGTYELCGPKIQGNPESFHIHVLVRHGYDVLRGCPRTFGALRAYLQRTPIEGVVWHHEDGRMAKIKAKDFGMKRMR